MRRNRKFAVLLLAASLTLAGCFGKKQNKTPEAGASAEPDKVLYERALDDIKHGRHTVGRLTLQTLINTYPDSEYLAKAKLAIADSYYKEGGTANLTQAVAEYKDFMTFFPFLDEAAYAQMQVGMAHYRRMEKPDRDRTEARFAEEEFQAFLEKYPESKLAPQAEQRLREVQEVLAEGDFRIAHFYHVKGSDRAATPRLIDLTTRYPLYSQADRALWMLGDIFEKHEKTDIAAQYYARIVRDYPLSDMTSDAKAKLAKLGVPIPQPNAEALARMQRDRDFERERPGLLRRTTGGVLRSRPDVSMAARTGPPTLTPIGETPGSESLTPGGKQTVGGGGVAGGSNSAVVTVATPGTSGSATTSGAASTTQPSAAGTENPPKTDSSASSSSSTDPKAAPDASPASDIDKDKSKDAKKDDKNKESTSKKKKGLRRIIPW